MNYSIFPQDPENNFWGILNFFTEIFASQGAPPGIKGTGGKFAVSTNPVANL
jgi:hypothetical protein